MSHGAARADKTSRNRTFGSGSLRVISGAKLFFTRGSAPPRQPAQNAVEIANLAAKGYKPSVLGLEIRYRRSWPSPLAVDSTTLIDTLIPNRYRFRRLITRFTARHLVICAHRALRLHQNRSLAAEPDHLERLEDSS